MMNGSMETNRYNPMIINRIEKYEVRGVVANMLLATLVEPVILTGLYTNNPNLYTYKTLVVVLD